MAVYIGTKQEIFSAENKRHANSVFLGQQPVVVFGNWGSGIPINTAINIAGIQYDGSVSKEIFWKIHIYPKEIIKNIIVETTTYDITIWNADYENLAVITDIQKENEVGITLDHSALPIDLMRGDAKIHILTILKQGPAIQDTTITYTINTKIYIVSIYGKRVIIFPYEPVGNLKIKYRFQTIITQNERFTEQRRALLPIMLRNIAADFIFREVKAEKFVNDIRFLSTKIVAVPVYSEPFFSTNSLKGQIIINTNTDLLNYYNLRNLCSMVLIKRISDDEAEIKEIEEVQQDFVEVKTPVVEEFIQGDTVIYPVIIAILDSKSIQLATNRIVRSSLSFKEVRI